MKRIHLFEFMDQTWYPQTFRRMQADYLQFVATLNTGHHSLIPLFSRALNQGQTNEIVDLCSGGTGPWLRLQEQFEQAGLIVTINLTDKYPHPEAVKRWKSASSRRILYRAESVDAIAVPDHLKGMRTLFEGFHHFKPGDARSILADAVEKNMPIGIFEASLKGPFGFLLLLLSPLMTVLGYFVMTPFFKPRRFSRFVWTYLIPIVPLATCWDGVISLLRVYSPEELEELVSSLQRDDYTWEIGLASTGTPIFDFTYLIGYPASVN